MTSLFFCEVQRFVNSQLNYELRSQIYTSFEHKYASLAIKMFVERNHQIVGPKKITGCTLQVIFEWLLIGRVLKGSLYGYLLVES